MFLFLLMLQAVDDNDEAEQMIRAITHGDIDHSVYSQMADDLENAVQHRKSETSKATKKKKKVCMTIAVSFQTLCARLSG